MESIIRQITEGDYKVFVEILPTGDKTSDTMLRLLTKYEGSKNPNELQRKYEFILSVKEIDNLIRAVQEAKIQALRRDQQSKAESPALV